MNHLENLQKLHATLCEKLKETDERRDYEAKHGSVGAAENLADECKELNEAIESLEWGMGQIEELRKLNEYMDAKVLEEMKTKIVKP